MTPVLVYPDVRAAVAWLEAAFGFVEHVKIGEDHRSQLGFGDGAVIVGDVRGERRPPRQGEETHAVMVRVEDARSVLTAGIEPGTRLVLPVNHFDGNYTADRRTLDELAAEGRVVLRYVENPNGSADDIAGVRNGPDPDVARPERFDMVIPEA